MVCHLLNNEAMAFEETHTHTHRHSHIASHAQARVMYSKRRTRKDLLLPPVARPAEPNRQDKSADPWEERLDSSVKRSGNGYIESLYSANCNGSMRPATQVSEIDVDKQTVPCIQPHTEGPAQVGGIRCADRSKLFDTLFFERQFSDDQKSQTPSHDAETEVEYIDSGELMKDCTDLEIISNGQSCWEFHADPLLEQTQEGAQHPIHVFNRAASLPRAKYMTLLDNLDDINAVASKSLTYDNELMVEIDSVNTCRQEVDGFNVASSRSSDHRSNFGIHPLRKASSENSCRLQMVLSRKYIFNDDNLAMEDMQSLPDDRASPSNYTVNSSYPLGRGLLSVASLKDWLPSEDPPVMHPLGSHETCQDVDIFGSSHKILGNGLLRTNSVLLKYVHDHSDFAEDSHA